MGLPTLLVAIAAVMVSVFLFVHVPRERQVVLRDATGDLSDRARLRRFAIEAWIADGLSDARTVIEFPTTGMLRTDHATTASGPRAHLDHVLQGFARAQGVTGIAVLGPELQVRSRSRADLVLGAGALELARAARASGHDTVEIVPGPGGAPEVVFVAPGSDAAHEVAVVIDDPERWLYPALAMPPYPATSADAVLLRLDGDAVRLLSPRRGEPGSALRERVPIDRDDELTGAAIAGRDTAGVVRDRGGRRVVAAVLGIPDNSWGLVLKVDEREVLAPFRERVWVLGLGIGMFAFSLAALALVLVWGRRRAAETARASEHARLTALFERAADPVLFLGTDGVIRAATRRAEEFYGSEPGALVGRRSSEVLCAPEARAVAEREHERTLREGRAVFETTHLGAGGVAVPVEVSSRAADFEGERVVVAVVRDITARRRADEQLRQLSRAVESSPVGILITDPKGVIEYVNPRYLGISGYDASEVVGRDASLLRSGEMDPATYRDMWARISSGHEWRGELINRRKDGTLYWADVSISPLRDALGRISHYVGIQEDIDERKRAQEMLRVTQTQLLQAQKMETVGRLAGGVAHDFNNLLTIIHGYGELLLVAFPPGSEDRDKVEEILKASRRAAQLTRQLLAFGRRQVLEPRVLDLRTSIADSERMLRRVIGEDIELEVVRPAALGNVKADPGQIEQVLLNLVVNARDAMPDGGRLILALADVTLDAAVDGVAEPVAPGSYVELAVRDTGQGMPPEVRAHLFEPFFTTKEVGKGTGLGLATVYGIIKQSGGFVSVESAPGVGSTFRILLPRVDEPLGGESPDAPAGGRLGRGERVLLVEDDDAVRGLAWALLDESGFRVTAARDGAEALELAARAPAAIDLLVTDVVMPGMSGHELARRLRESRPGVAVLFVSGYSDEAALQDVGLGAGVRFLQKPFTAQTLALAVREALGARVPDA